MNDYAAGGFEEYFMLLSAHWAMRLPNRKRSHIIFLCIGFLLWAATLSPVIHNDDHAHIVHPLAHSAVCKWVKDANLSRIHMPTRVPVFIAFAFSLLFLILFQLSHWATLRLPRRKVLFAVTRHNRSPPK